MTTMQAARTRSKNHLNPKQLLPRTDQYAEFLRNKRCIIVGPAGYMDGKGLGPWIDSHDVVIKMNWGETLRNRADFGRTDVLYKRLLKLGHADEILVQEYLEDHIQWVIAIDSVSHNRVNIDYLKATIGDRIPWFIDSATRQGLTRELKTSALLGPITVRHLLNHAVKSVTVTGCDFYMSSYAHGYGGTPYRTYMRRTEGTIGPTHDGPKQIRWLAEQQARDGRLNFDETLSAIVKHSPPDPKLVEGVVAIVPARYESSRFPGKPLALINDRPMVLHVADRVSSVIPKVVVATDDRRIADVVRAGGYKAVMTGPSLTGTDRVAAAASQVVAQIYVNVQGDEPLVDPSAILTVLEAKRKHPKEVINAMTRLDPADADNRDVVKAVLRAGKYMAYCSRVALPAGREGHAAAWKQLGLYAFNRRELQMFAGFKKRPYLEEAEDVEMLRFVDLGVPVRMIEVAGSAQSVDRPEHIEIIERLMNADIRREAEAKA